MALFDTSVLMTCILTGLIAVLVGLIFLLNRKPPRLPPGPLSLPLIGSALSLWGPDPRKAMLRLAQQYGDIFTLDLGGTRTVILASYDVIHEILANNGAASSGRPLNNLGIKILTENGKGVAFNEGRSWVQHRKIMSSYIRDHCVGQEFEMSVTEEIEHLIEVLNAQKEKPLDPIEPLKKAVVNVINKVIYGHRFEYWDPRYSQKIKAIQEGAKLAASGGFLALFPWLRYLPGDIGPFKNINGIADVLDAGVQTAINEHEETYRAGVTRDIVDKCIEETRSQMTNGQKDCYEIQTAAIVRDLIISGYETVPSSLIWLLIYLIHNHDVKERVLTEVDDVIGSSRKPTMEDKANMPYTHAVLLEVQRIAYAVAALPHKATQDISFGEYTIPSGTSIMPLFFAANRDAKIWPNPNDFQPERFLNDRGEIRITQHYIPFGMGPRVCPGQPIANTVLFLFFVSLMQHFELVTVPGQPLPELEGLVGVTHIPKPFQLIFKRKYGE